MANDARDGAVMEFGFYPLPFDKTIGDITFRTLKGLDAKVLGVKESGWVENGWCYAPRQQRQWMGGGVETLPYSARVFGLQKTHELTHASATGDDHLRFLIQCFGFFTGIRQTDTEAGFLDATPIESNKTTDMVWMAGLRKESWRSG